MPAEFQPTEVGGNSELRWFSLRFCPPRRFICIQTPSPLPNSLLADLPVAAIVEDLATRGYSVIPEFFPIALIRELLNESQNLREIGTFQDAGVGRAAATRRVTEIRTDSVHWLDATQLSASSTMYWNRMEILRESLNRELYLGLVELEAHLAEFAEGGFYAAHLDQHRTSSARVISTILYLDEDWLCTDGGALRLYTDSVAGIAGTSVDIYPEPGKLVVFLSADYWHEVLISHRNRHSLTGWFRRQEN